MAASKDKASALKNSYVDGIIDELGGASDPAVRMALREGDQASVHIFPAEGKIGGINDGDPGLYIHGNDKSYQLNSSPDQANPVTDQGPGGRQLMDLPEDAINDGNIYLDGMERRMGGSGDLARARPKSQEDYKRKPQLLGNASFDASNLGGAMGMEQGQSASVIHDLVAGTTSGRNDGDPTVYLVRGNKTAPVRNQGDHVAYPHRNQGPGYFRQVPTHMSTHRSGSNIFNHMERNGDYFINKS